MEKTLAVELGKVSYDELRVQQRLLHRLELNVNAHFDLRNDATALVLGKLRRVSDAERERTCDRKKRTL
jgi:hypothetical protein